MNGEIKKIITPEMAEEIYYKGRVDVVGIIVDLSEVIVALSEEVNSLRAQVNQNSKNSSWPPSSDPPNSNTHSGTEKSSGRKPGGQPGHEGKHRLLIPIEKVNQIIKVKPDSCWQCGKYLEGDDKNPFRHQVIEIPKPEAHTTEYQIHSLKCFCGETTSGVLPEGVPTGNFGFRLTATIGAASGIYHLSKRNILSLMKDWFGVDLSLGSISACEQKVSEALQETYEEAHQFAQTQPVKYADETGWRENRKKAWLWCMVTGTICVYMIRLGRGKIVAKELLGRVLGFLVTDRWHAYNFWSIKKRQICWAHLLRLFQYFSECPGKTKKIGDQLLLNAKMMFKWWHKVRDGTISRKMFQKKMIPLKIKIEGLLEMGAQSEIKKVSGSCKRILKLKPALWAFVYKVGVEPTNNTGERAIRKGVLWRKVSFGTHSTLGSFFVERILTVSTSLRMQERNVSDFITASIHAHAFSQQKPSLIFLN